MDLSLCPLGLERRERSSARSSDMVEVGSVTSMSVEWKGMFRVLCRRGMMKASDLQISVKIRLHFILMAYHVELLRQLNTGCQLLAFA